MIRFIKFQAIIAFVLLPLLVKAQINELPRSTPEAEGVKSGAICAMLDTLAALPNTDIHHVMIVRHGKVVAEYHPAPYKAEYRHTLYSCSKTFVSLAVGLAIYENRLRLTDRVAPFFPEELPDTISANLAQMTVEDLLTMRSGITTDWDMRNHNSNWVKSYLAKPVDKPNDRFRYDSMCTYMLSAILQKVTGMKTLDYLKPRFFAPLNISEVDWEESPTGVTTGGWGLRLQSESLAKFGILLINKGVWNGKQVIPAEWVEEASTFKADNTNGAAKGAPSDGNQGYCYQMWRSKYPGSFRADGAYGQFVVVVPEKDIVVVINGNCIGVTDKELNSIWDILIPGVIDNAKLIAGKDYNALQKKCANAQLQLPQGSKNSPLAKDILGKKIILQKNNHKISALNIMQKDNSYLLTVTQEDGVSYDMTFDYKAWSCFTTTTQPPYSIQALYRISGIKNDFVVAGAYAWNKKNELTMKAHYANWISSRTFLLTFSGKDVEVMISENFSLDSKETIKATID